MDEQQAPQAPSEADVVVIGSGFGGAVAALRFAEAGQRVVVLERGDHVSRERFQADIDAVWMPERNAYGMHDLQKRGTPIIPWIGAAVGGGSHVYAGTLKRRHDWDGFPAEIGASDMPAYYARAEQMMEATPYPDYPPYSEVRAYQVMRAAGARCAQAHPDLVEEHGAINLAIAFAPKGGTPGAEFTNAHGARQRYYDPDENSLLGGDIDAKSSLDRNYLHLAQRAAVPAQIVPLCEADEIERLDDGRYRVHYAVHHPKAGWAGVRHRWLRRRPQPDVTWRSIVARRVVVAAGAVGSTELLMRNRDVFETLPEVGPHVGTRYTTNGDYLTLLVFFRGLWPALGGLVAMIACLVAALAFGVGAAWYGLGAGAAVYYGALAWSGRPMDPDRGTTNSEHICFRGHRGQRRGAYIESGRYPTPGRLFWAMVLSGVTGRFRPRLYAAIAAGSKVLREVVPPFGFLARLYPVPLLSMGRDDALGTMKLRGGKVEIQFDLKQNAAFYAHLDELGRKLGKAAGARWAPHLLLQWLGRMEIPHNQGGVPMGRSAADGVVDHAGRVFGLPDLMVLDGSIIPVSVGPNPALTILALAERAMEIVVKQLEDEGRIHAAPAAGGGGAA